MARRVLGSALLLVVLGACSASSEQPQVAVDTNLAIPRAVLGRVAKLTLTVFEGSFACDAATGSVTFPDGPSGAREIARTDLRSSDCAADAKFCGNITIEKSSASRAFSAVAKDGSDATLAVGCAVATVDQDALPIAIRMFRFLAPAECNDGTIQPTEQCEPGGTALCDDACQSKELLVSTGSSQNGTQSGGVGDKTAPFLLWPASSGNQGRFFAFYTDRNASGSNNLEVGLRALADDLTPLTSPPALASGSIFLPNGPTFPPAPSPRQQSLPQAAFSKGKYYVVFQDDDTPGSNGIDIHLRSMDAALVAEQGPAPLGINGVNGAGEAAIQGAPAIAAGPRDRLFIAWEDSGQGRIAGRTLTPPSTLGNQNSLSSDTGTRGVSVAATATGWVAVWQSGTAVKLRAVNEDGVPQGAEQTVNEAGATTERPRIASLADGRFAVAWSASGQIFVQRFDAKGAKIAGDQLAPVSAGAGGQTTPSIAGTTGAGGSYVVAWLDTATSHVRARMLGGSGGYLFNNVNGQSTEFQASRVEDRTRANPVVVSGGSGPFVAIGWEDRTSPGAGIVVRRFPLPSD